MDLMDGKNKCFEKARFLVVKKLFKTQKSTF